MRAHRARAVVALALGVATAAAGFAVDPRTASAQTRSAQPAPARGATARETIEVVIPYLMLADDPHYSPPRRYTGLRLKTPQRPLAGAELALRGARVQGRARGLAFRLEPVAIAAAADVVAALAERYGADAPLAALVDLPLAMTRALAAGTRADSVLLNVRLPDDRLRGEDCAPNLYHLVPSDAMRADALAQFLNAKGWTRVLQLVGPEPRDETLADAFATAAGRFGLDIVERRAFVYGRDPRERDRNTVSLLTGGPEHDVVHIADSIGDFSRYVPYQTRRPVPVVGGEGLLADAWHWTWERHGAPQLNQRFERNAGRRMGAEDWAGWAAARTLVGAIVRGGSTTVPDIARHLLSDAFSLDLYKGAPGSFRNWNRQLRQPVLLYTHNAVVARAPIDGFLHRTNDLDTLGVDAPESRCGS